MTYRHNKRLERFAKLLFITDQKDRMKKSEAGILQDEDRARYAFAKMILSGYGKQLSSRILYSIAMVLHHSGNANDLAIAQVLANTAAIKGHAKARWLWAALLDRRLILLGKPQRYGTQFKLDAKTGRMHLMPIDGLCSDVERVGLGLPTIPEIMKVLN